VLLLAAFAFRGEDVLDKFGNAGWATSREIKAGLRLSGMRSGQRRKSPRKQNGLYDILLAELIGNPGCQAIIRVAP